MEETLLAPGPRGGVFVWFGGNWRPSLALVSGVLGGAALGFLALGCEQAHMGEAAHDSWPSAEGGREGLAVEDAADELGVYQLEVAPLGTLDIDPNAGLGEWSGTAGAGGAGPEPEPPRQSVFCGDGVVGGEEECDDGPDLERADLCTPTCQVEDALVELQPPLGDEPVVSLGRTLGQGRHPLAGGPAGFAVAFVQEPHADDGVPFVGVGLYAMPEPVLFGQPLVDRDPAHPLVDVSTGTRPVLFADPVVAALGDGSFAVAFTDHDGDGDALGIALRRVDPEASEVGALRHANAAGDFSQYDADLIALPGGGVLAAWTDERDGTTGPDIYTRRLGDDLNGPAEDQLLVGTAAAEGHVALTPFGGAWAAAWRASAPEPGEEGFDAGRETVEVELADGTHFTVLEPTTGGELEAFLPGSADDRPAIVPLGATHLLVLFTVGTDPEGTGIATVSRLRAALLDVAAGSPDASTPVAAELVPEVSDADPTRCQSHPVAVVAGAGEYQRLFLAWRAESDGSTVLPGSSAPPGGWGSQGNAVGDELWLKEASLGLAGPDSDYVFTAGGVDYGITLAPARPLPRWDAGLPADQRFPALASLPYPHQSPPYDTAGALLAGWQTYGAEHGALVAQPDIMVQMSPLPLAERTADRTDDCASASGGCGAGEGPCTSDDDCAGALVCAPGLGPNFGYGPLIGLCVPGHCTNGSTDAGESGIDCGGDCGSCAGVCGNGVPEWPYGEHCDDGNTDDDTECPYGLPTCTMCSADCSTDLPGLSGSYCGDGVVDADEGELCDPGEDPSCPANCGQSACDDPATCFHVRYYPGDGPFNESIRPHFVLTNSSSEPVSLAGLTIRYWFTVEGVAACGVLELECWWAAWSNTSGTDVCGALSLSTNELATPLAGATHSFDVTLPPGAPVLQPGASTDLFQMQIHWCGYTPNFNETNDYSHSYASTPQPSLHLAAYRGGQLIWGVEP